MPGARHRRWWQIIFLSPTEPRLRAGWRLLLQAGMQIALTLAAGCGALIIASGSLMTLIGNGSAAGLAWAEVVEVGTVTLSVFLARRLLDRRSFASLGLALSPRTLLDLAAGIVITLVMMGMIFALEWRLGWLTFQGFSWGFDPLQDVVFNVLLFLLIFCLVGWSEELMSRGYHLQTLASGLTLTWGLVLSSAIFGALHLGNPHASWVSVLGIFLAGILLGYAFVRTGLLWLSIGLHVGWNFFEGVVFGFPVSGLSLYHVTLINVTGPVMWTGGDFGPEAGLVVVPAIAVGIGLIYLYTRQRTRL